MINPREDENETWIEQILNQDIVPIEEQLTIIDSLHDNYIKLAELEEKENKGTK